jgi:hypothetical protein
MVEHALGEQEETAWTYTDENLAMLIDRLDYWLSSEYVGWVTDPNDPEEKRKSEERKRSGVKPPPVPIIPPVAKRPPDVAREVVRFNQALRDHYSTPDVVKPGESDKDALDRILG